jgi:hypothetical protein
VTGGAAAPLLPVDPMGDVLAHACSFP